MSANGVDPCVQHALTKLLATHVLGIQEEQAQKWLIQMEFVLVQQVGIQMVQQKHVYFVMLAAQLAEDHQTHNA